jgi:hypothetical protein
MRVGMAAAQETYLSDVGAALITMRDRMEEIERTNDCAAMREQIELLVPRIVIHTEVLDAATGSPRKRATARMQLAFGEKSAVVSTTSTSGGDTSRNGTQIAPLRVECELMLSRSYSRSKRPGVGNSYPIARHHAQPGALPPS